MTVTVRLAAIFAAAVVLSACVRTSVMQVSQNQVVITAEAAPACGKGGSQQAAQEAAAIETIKRGYQRFIILEVGSENNVRVVRTPPTTATTTTGPGGTATTTFTGGSTIATGTHDTSIRIVMLNPCDQGFYKVLDARQVLGPDWEKKVQEGVKSC
ncbi:MAG: hypothetical protein ACK6A4_08865 [Alphaproteobacteria bacterium]